MVLYIHSLLLELQQSTLLLPKNKIMKAPIQCNIVTSTFTEDNIELDTPHELTNSLIKENILAQHIIQK